LAAARRHVIGALGTGRLQRSADSGLAAGRVAVALSGGVDSSVAAALLLDEGHELFGVTLRLRDCEEGVAGRSCCGVDGLSRAQEVAGRLGIAHYVLDCSREFSAEVLRPAWEEYAAGRTPSPCLLCNERIKFGVLLDWVRRLGAAALATGHYARVGRDDGGRPSLRRAQDSNKDQSYFLAGLSSDQLGSVRFPLGELRKGEVRARARALGLPNAEVKDSQDACLWGPTSPLPRCCGTASAALPGPVPSWPAMELCWAGTPACTTSRSGSVGASRWHPSAATG
jgi:tRNA-specific 2-thiouridylase